MPGKHMSRKDWKNLVIVLAIVIALLGILVLFGRGVSARDLDGRYIASPLHEWFNHLASGKGLCCSVADGETVVDADWDSKDGHYRVHLDGQWIDVPDEAVIKEPNLFGRTMVWPIRTSGTPIEIRCFIAGSMT